MAPKVPPLDRQETWPLAKLVPYAQNPRTHPAKQVAEIAASMKEFGQTQVVVVDGDKGPGFGEIIVGHGRVQAAQQLGWTEIRVAMAVGWTQAQKRRYRILDNRVPMNAGWDQTLLKMELTDLAELKISPLDMGFEAGELAALDASGFLTDMINTVESGTEGGLQAGSKGVALKFSMLPSERDTVIAWLAAERDRLKLRTTAEALVALAKARKR